MNRRSRTDAELQSASMVVAYEVEMLKRAGQDLDASGSDHAKRNVALESFLIHARNLLHFLYESEQHAHSNDVVVVDYTGAGLTTSPPDYRSICDRISKHLAHITYRRQQKETWDCQALADIIRDGLEEFRNATPDSRLDPRWQSPDPLQVQLSFNTHGVTNSLGILPPHGPVGRL
jgi:hypothetical protein